QDALNEQAKLENDPAKKAELQNEAKQWGEGGAYRVALHTVIGGLVGGTSGALGAGASAAAAPLLNELQDSIASALKGAGANDSVAKLAGQLISGATAAGIGAAAGGTQGAMTAFNADANNRQLHPDEAAFIKRQARAYAARNNMSEEDAERTLMRGALYANDADWQSAYQKYTPEEVAAYQQAAAYLTAQATASGFVFTNPEGQMQAGFTSTASQFANERYLMRQALTDTQTRSMYSDRAAIALGEMSTRNQFGFGKQAVTGFGSGIADGVENALKGYAGLVDPATYGKLVDAAKTLAADPSGTIRRLADGLKGGAQDAALNVYLDYLQKDSAELGKTAGAIFGQALVDVAATASGIAVVKNAGRIGEGVADIQAAVARRVAVEIDKTATEALLRSGGAFDKAGNPLLDMSKLSNDQKRVMGEQLFGPNTIKQIVPDGQQIARMQGPGSTGIDDLYKVNRPDVDYVVVEYKFVGQDNKTGAQVLGSTADGKQGSDSWVLGSGRLEKAVGIDNARDVLASTKTGRMEMWVVTTRPDGSTIVEVLDALGKPKPTDTSRILSSGLNLSGARP
ncbi:MAG: hypothetical protein QG584_1115, partial [Pseudomonadota bacterium]|nr:hypothetical protein [Pseudomonadota bacterium]